MKKIFLLLLFIGSIHIAYAQADEQAISSVLAAQAAAWNNGSIDEYMHGYWNNDSLVFVGKNGPTYGYQQTLERYKKSYSDAAKMGKLSFDILQVRRLSSDYYFVLGKWALKRSVGDVGGSFTLLFRRIKGKWKIVADHSS
ncbi:MAG: YybH family protein [Flavipsychrobacter sp.]